MKTISEIKKKIKPGDITTAALALGISQSNASKGLHREGSKYHSAMLQALSKVIDLRENFINSNTEA